MASPLFHVVLYQPEIPNNTGNIGRTCVATGCSLHLVHPIGFDTSEKACRRAGLDYWPRLTVHEHASWERYLAVERPASAWYFTTKTNRLFCDVALRAGDHLVFGPETRGMPGDILEARAARCVTLPMVAGERSLNLATAVCAAVYEGVRQLIVRGEATVDRATGRLAAGAKPGSA